MRALLPIYYISMAIMSRLLAMIGPLIPTIKDQTKHRFLSAKQLRKLGDMRQQTTSFFVFFASSAGEYEQALPLIAAIKKKNSAVGAVLILFSESGIRFAASQGESTPVIKAPWDNIFSWISLFKVLKPTATIVIRYELWPGFLKIAKYFGPLYLVNGVASHSAQGSRIASSVQSYLVKSFNKIFVVNDRDQSFFTHKLGYPASQVVVSGDTKYDRVRERLSLREHKRATLEQHLDASWGRRKRLLLGSGWHQDIEALLEAFAALKSSRNDWQIIIAPHDTSEAMVVWIEKHCFQLGFKVARFSQREHLDSTVAILVIDSVGLLPEFYGCVDMAFVGGAMHFRVHNVLEPAIRGIPICFGPLHTTSKEAVHLVSHKLATVITDADSIKVFMESNISNDKSQNKARKQEVEKLCGATQRVIAELHGVAYG